jgi:hypothetical protein
VVAGVDASAVGSWAGLGAALPYFILAGLLIVATFIDFEHYIIR